MILQRRDDQDQALSPVALMRAALMASLLDNVLGCRVVSLADTAHPPPWYYYHVAPNIRDRQAEADEQHRDVDRPHCHEI
jgi:hypothetical protein